MTTSIRICDSSQQRFVYYYHAMLRRLAERGYATVCRLYVSLFVRLQVPWSQRLEYFEHNLMAEEHKVNAWTNPNMGDWCNGNTPEIRAE